MGLDLPEQRLDVSLQDSNDPFSRFYTRSVSTKHVLGRACTQLKSPEGGVSVRTRFTLLFSPPILPALEPLAILRFAPRFDTLSPPLEMLANPLLTMRLFLPQFFYTLLAIKEG